MRVEDIPSLKERIGSNEGGRRYSFSEGKDRLELKSFTIPMDNPCSSEKNVTNNPFVVLLLQRSRIL